MRIQPARPARPAPLLLMGTTPPKVDFNRLLNLVETAQEIDVYGRGVAQHLIGAPYQEHLRRGVPMGDAQSVYILVDISTSGALGTGLSAKRRAAAESLALMAHAALLSGDRVGLMLFSDTAERTIEARCGQHHVLSLVREVLGYNASGRGTDVTAALAAIGRKVRDENNVGICIISDFLQDVPEADDEADDEADGETDGEPDGDSYDDPYDGMAAALRRAAKDSNLLALHVYDSDDYILPEDPVDVDLNEGEGEAQIISLHGGDSEIQQRLTAVAKHHRALVSETLALAKVGAVSLDASGPWRSDLVRFLTTVPQS